VKQAAVPQQKKTFNVQITPDFGVRRGSELCTRNLNNLLRTGSGNALKSLFPLRMKKKKKKIPTKSRSTSQSRWRGLSFKVRYSIDGFVCFVVRVPIIQYEYHSSFVLHS